MIKDVPIHVERGGVAIILGSEAMTGAPLALRRTMRGADRHGAEGALLGGGPNSIPSTLFLCPNDRSVN